MCVIFVKWKREQKYLMTSSLKYDDKIIVSKSSILAHLRNCSVILKGLGRVDNEDMDMSFVR